MESYLIIALCAVTLALVLLLLWRGRPDARQSGRIETILEQLRKAMGDAFAQARQDGRGEQEALRRALYEMNESLHATLDGIRRAGAEQNDRQAQTAAKALEALQKSNEAQLEKMRQTVDEKLQETLTTRIEESFKRVSGQLEQVHKGLGEMQTLAQDVGGLKRVLANVKTRGMLGEIQLGAILEELLSPEQYQRDYRPRPDSREVVEYAVRLPGDDETPVYLPIDAKFPADAYAALQEAGEAGDPETVRAAANWQSFFNQSRKFR
jgi:DNA recombination protein RmuC